MSATSDAKYQLECMRQKVGESDVEFAHRRFDMQIEVYSANAGSDLDYEGSGLRWSELETQNRQSWIEGAKRHTEKYGYDK